jgi:hypothetical protein
MVKYLTCKLQSWISLDAGQGDKNVTWIRQILAQYQSDWYLLEGYRIGTSKHVRDIESITHNYFQNQTQLCSPKQPVGSGLYSPPHTADLRYNHRCSTGNKGMYREDIEFQQHARIPLYVIKLRMCHGGRDGQGM